MKKLFWIIMILFYGCNDSKKNIDLEEAVNHIKQNTSATLPQSLIQQAQILIDTAKTHQYQLLTIQELQKMMEHQQIVLIDVSPKGSYLLEHLHNAKHIEVSISKTPLNKENFDNLKETLYSEFQTKLGQNFLIPIVFYSHKESQTSQPNAADIACIWAKKMGYHNVYRLIGGLEAWKARHLPTTNETPQCCH